MKAIGKGTTSGRGFGKEEKEKSNCIDGGGRESSYAKATTTTTRRIDPVGERRSGARQK
jgi:hypothetical protein